MLSVSHYPLHVTPASLQTMCRQGSKFANSEPGEMPVVMLSVLLVCIKATLVVNMVHVGHVGHWRGDGLFIQAL